MSKITQKDIFRIMKEEYISHLRGVLNEVQVFDSRGKMIIGKDLKVIHKPSGYEYTVDSVKGKNGEAMVTLRTPETPRPSTQDINHVVGKDYKKELKKKKEQEFKFPDIELEMDEPDDDDSVDTVDRGKKAHPKPVKPPTKDQIFVVDQADFEKEYEEA